MGGSSSKVDLDPVVPSAKIANEGNKREHPQHKKLSKLVRQQTKKDNDKFYFTKQLTVVVVGASGDEAEEGGARPATLHLYAAKRVSRIKRPED